MTFRYCHFAKVFLFVFLVMCGVPVLSAHAQQGFYNMEKPMPEVEPMDSEAFNATTKQYDEVAFGDPRLNYSIRIPKDWVKSENRGVGRVSIDKRVLYEIGRYYGPPSMLTERSYVTINALELKHKLSVEQWFAMHIMKNGYNMEGVEVFDENHLEALYVHVERGETFAVRSAVWSSGKVLFIVQYYTPMSKWAEEKAIAQGVVKSFVIENPSDEPVEDMKIYRFLDIAEFSYPVSWGLKAAPLRSADKMSAELYNVVNDRYSNTQVLKGKIEISLLSNFVIDDVETELDKLKKSVSSDVLLMDERLDADLDYNVDERFKLLRSGAFTAIDRSQSIVGYEFWYTVMEAGDYYYFLTLLTPARKDDFASWSRNMQTFRIINEWVRHL